MAGHDVLAITLSAIMYYLARSPEPMAKLREELSSLDKECYLADPTPYEKILKLPYLSESLIIFHCSC
jgi:cytochrome P450